MGGQEHAEPSYGTRLRSDQGRTGYHILKAHDLITSPAFVVITAADRFQHPTTRPNELWQTNFTYLRVVGWGWYYLSTVPDDYSSLHPGVDAHNHHGRDRCRDHRSTPIASAAVPTRYA
jgi:hypothetical protein